MNRSACKVDDRIVLFFWKSQMPYPKCCNNAPLGTWWCDK